MKNLSIEEGYLIHYDIPDTCSFDDLGQLYRELFPGVIDGVFVEIGAYDGITCSNTSCLAKLGWTGHYVEPVLDSYALCKKYYSSMPKISCYNIAISDCNELLEFSIADAVSGAHAAHNKITFDFRKKTPDIVQCVAVSLNRFFEDNSIPSGIDLLVVDVEGYEYKILRKFDFLKWAPRVLIVEVNDQCPPYDLACQEILIKESAALISHILSCNYTIYFRDSLNVVFVLNTEDKNISGNV